jgi:HEAT repeat protein
VSALRQLGSREVFDRAVEWCKSSDALVRARGLDVIAQLGRTEEHPANNFPEESFSLVSNLIKQETEITPLASAIAAIGNFEAPDALPIILQFAHHPNREIRFHVACALGSFADDERSIKALLQLSEDADDEVRNWATFGIGTLSALDSLDIRETLVRRLADTNREVRDEGIAGLARRRDKRALLPLIEALEQPEVGDLMIEAGYAMLGKNSADEHWDAHNLIEELRDQMA